MASHASPPPEASGVDPSDYAMGGAALQLTERAATARAAAPALRLLEGGAAQAARGVAQDTAKAAATNAAGAAQQALGRTLLQAGGALARQGARFAVSTGAHLLPAGLVIAGLYGVVKLTDRLDDNEAPHTPAAPLGPGADGQPWPAGTPSPAADAGVREPRPDGFVHADTPPPGHVEHASPREASPAEPAPEREPLRIGAPRLNDGSRVAPLHDPSAPHAAFVALPSASDDGMHPIAPRASADEPPKTPQADAAADVEADPPVPREADPAPMEKNGFRREIGAILDHEHRLRQSETGLTGWVTRHLPGRIDPLRELPVSRGALEEIHTLIDETLEHRECMRAQGRPEAVNRDDATLDGLQRAEAVISEQLARDERDDPDLLKRHQLEAQLRRNAQVLADTPQRAADLAAVGLRRAARRENNTRVVLEAQRGVLQRELEQLTASREALDDSPEVEARWFLGRVAEAEGGVPLKQALQDLTRFEMGETKNLSPELAEELEDVLSKMRDMPERFRTTTVAFDLFQLQRYVDLANRHKP